MHNIIAEEIGVKTNEKQKNVFSLARVSAEPFKSEMMKTQRKLRRARRNTTYGFNTTFREKAISVLKEEYKEKRKVYKEKLKQVVEEHVQEVCEDLEKCGNFNFQHYSKILERLTVERKASKIYEFYDAEGTKHVLPDQIAAGFRSYFENLLNIDVQTDPEVLEELRSVMQNEELDKLPTEEEIMECIKAIGKKKAQGEDETQVEFLELWMDTVEKATLVELFQKVWITQKVPQTWKDIDIVPIFKNKGKPSDYTKYRGIALISQMGKVLSKLIERRLTKHSEIHNLIPETQFGFQKGKGVHDPIYIARRIQEMAKLAGVDAFWCFVDIAKAYDSVHRETLWLLLDRYGVPPKMLNILRNWHTDMQARVKFNGVESEKFDIKTGLRQGDVISPLLFNIYFGAIVEVMTKRLNATVRLTGAKPPGMEITYKIGSKPWMRTRNVRKRVIGGHHNEEGVWVETFNYNEDIFSSQYIWNLLFADDAAFVASSKEQLQTIVTIFDEVCTAFGLSIAIAKTEVLIQINSRDERDGEKEDYSIFIKGQRLPRVYSFKYLGSTFNSKANLESELRRRIASAEGKYHQLKEVFKSDYITVETKVKLYKLTVLGGLLWDCNNWIDLATDSHFKQLETFNLRKITTILGFDSFNYISYEQKLELTNTTRIQYIVRGRRLAMIGRIQRKENSSLQKIALYGTIKTTNNEFINRDTPSSKALKSDIDLFQMEEVFAEETITSRQWHKSTTTKRVELNASYIDRKRPDFKVISEELEHAMVRRTAFLTCKKKKTSPMLPCEPDTEISRGRRPGETDDDGVEESHHHKWIWPPKGKKQNETIGDRLERYIRDLDRKFTREDLGKYTAKEVKDELESRKIPYKGAHNRATLLNILWEALITTHPCLT